MLTHKTPKKNRAKFWFSKLTRFRIIATSTCFETTVIFFVSKRNVTVLAKEGSTERPRNRWHAIVVCIMIIYVNHLGFLGQGWCFEQTEFGRRLSVYLHHILGVNGILNEFIFTWTATFITLQTCFFNYSLALFFCNGTSEFLIARHSLFHSGVSDLCVPHIPTTSNSVFHCITRSISPIMSPRKLFFPDARTTYWHV